MKKILSFLLFTSCLSLYGKEDYDLKTKRGEIFSLSFLGRDWVYIEDSSYGKVNLLKISDYNKSQVFTFSIKDGGVYTLHFLENNLENGNFNKKDFLIQVGDESSPEQVVDGLDSSLNIKNLPDLAIDSNNIASDNNTNIDEVKNPSGLKKTDKTSLSSNSQENPISLKPVKQARIVEEKITDDKKNNDIEVKNTPQIEEQKETIPTEKQKEIVDDFFLQGIDKSLSKEIRDKIESIILDAKNKENVNEDEALSTYEKLIKNYAFYDKLDEVYYSLAKIYEKNGKNQNLVKAKDMYKAIVENFALSKYFKESMNKVNFFKEFYSL